jgi:uncharacterized membrane protein YdbT with pleckstrin-like domain
MRTELKKDEKVLVIIRQHWLRLALPVVAWVLFTILIAIWLNISYTFILSLLAALVPGYNYLEWKHNLWAVTNYRVIDENGFISRYSKESPLDKINNVEYDQTLIGRLLGYGDVKIQTAAEMGDTTYNLIHHPKLLKDTITQAREEYQKMQTGKQATQLAEALAKTVSTNNNPNLVADELQKLFDLLQKGAITQEEYLQQKKKLLGT